MYTIGEVSEMFQIPISTLRYYDKEGLFPGIQRTSGIRKFGDREIDALRVIDCLKRSGMEIKAIKIFMAWCAEGDSTLSERLELFRKQEVIVKEEFERLEQTLAMIQYKCWYYETACNDGTEEKVRNMQPDQLPKEIQKMFNKAHRKK